MELTTANDVMNLEEFATQQGVSTRTIKRWLANDELPGAFKDPFTGEWRFPRDTYRQMQAKVEMPTVPSGALEYHPAFAPQHHPHALAQYVPQDQEKTRLEELAAEPAFLTIADASEFLGIPQAQILANPEVFSVMYVGVQGSPRVPKRVVYDFEGTR